jgi:acyl-CoA reductase-like NAD-dependent aldehyde dehydrogenase
MVGAAVDVAPSRLSDVSSNPSVIDHTLSGGACWNDISIQTIQRSLPFGGVGHSGCE